MIFTKNADGNIKSKEDDVFARKQHDFQHFFFGNLSNCA